MPSHFRGPLYGAPTSGALENAPSDLIARHMGRHRTITNNFYVAADVGVAGAPLTRVAIGGGTQALSLTVPGATEPYPGLVSATCDAGGANATGAQWAQGTGGSGFGPALGGGVARDYNPPLVVTFLAELALNTTGTNNCSLALGLVDTNAAVLAVTGLVTGANGFYFRIPQGAAGVSGVLTAVWSGGGANETEVTLPGITMQAGVAMRFGIRYIIKRLTAAATPAWTSNSDGAAEFFINDKLVRRLTFNDASTGLPPQDIGPGIAVVRIAADSANAFRLPYWIMDIGPIRSGATTV